MTESRSSPASAASDPTSSTARPMPTSRPDEDVLSIGSNRAVTLIEEKRARGPRKGPLRRGRRVARWASIRRKAVQSW